MDINEYGDFSYLSDYASKFESIKICLMTKIYNRELGRQHQDLLSIVFVTNKNECWAFGNNASGCLGLNSGDIKIPKPKLIKSFWDSDLVKLISGHRFVLALTSSGKCYSWGDNKFGQLGIGKTVAKMAKPMLISSIEDPIVDIDCGMYHSLALTQTFDVYSFGSNVTGAIGSGNTFHQFKPCKILNHVNELIGSDFVKISSGGWHSAAVNLKGDLFLWGWNQDAQCALPDLKNNVLAPIKPPTLERMLIKSVRCGQHHTLVLTFDGQVLACGLNEHGECAKNPAEWPRFSDFILIEISEHCDEIGAWAKSRVSIAHGEKTGSFYIWGQSRSSVANQSLLSYQIKRVTLNHSVDIQSLLNFVLAKNETSQFNNDHKLITQKQTFYFPRELILINSESSIPIKSSLTKTLNMANDCDLVFNVISSYQTHQIFVQQVMFENHTNFFQKIYLKFSPSSNNDESAQCSGSAAVDKNEKLLDNNLIDENNDFDLNKTIIWLNIGKNRRKFCSIDIDGKKLSFNTLYAYLLFMYSCQNYLITSSEELIKLLQFGVSIQSSSMIECCLSYVDNRFSIQQLCYLYSESVRLSLELIQNFCESKLLAVDSGELSKQLQLIYDNRNEKHDLEFEFFSSENSTTHVLHSHKLILLTQSNFYESLKKTNLINNNETTEPLFQLNGVQTWNEFFQLNRIRINVVEWQTFIHYLYYIYHRQFPLNQMSLETLIWLMRLSNRFGESEILNLVVELLRSKITIENVCQLFIQYCCDERSSFLSKNDKITESIVSDQIELKDLCVELAAKNVVQLISSDEFRRFLLEPMQHENFEIFMIELSNYIRKQNAFKKINF